MRCVICHPATAELPGELLTSLSRRMGRMTICTDIYAALAECCLFQREHAQHAGTDAGTTSGAGKPSAVLVLVHPRHLPDLGAVRLVETVRNYAPSIALWRYDRSANPKLRAVVEEDVATAFATTAHLTPPAPAAIPVARPHLPVVQTRTVENLAPKHVNGTHRAEPVAPTSPPALTPPTSSGGPANVQRGARATSLLTEDELRMLLSGDPFDGGPLGARSHHPPRAPNNGGAS